LKRSDKKLDEDEQRIKNRYKLFLNKASKVLTPEPTPESFQ